MALLERVQGSGSPFRNLKIGAEVIHSQHFTIKLQNGAAFHAQAAVEGEAMQSGRSVQLQYCAACGSLFSAKGDVEVEYVCYVLVVVQLQLGAGVDLHGSARRQALG